MDMAIQFKRINCKHITMHKQKAFIYKLSRSKTQNQNKFMLTETREKPWDFVDGATRASTSAPEMIFLT